MALDRTLILRAEEISNRAEWGLAPVTRDGAGQAILPPPVRGHFFKSYTERHHNGHQFRRAPDKLIPWGYEARISRRLGFKSIMGGLTVIYWRHLPIARLALNDEAPHIYISAFHINDISVYEGREVPKSGRVAGSQIRAMQAMNPLLDYLMTGVRITAKGVERHRGDTAPWPKTLNKPAVFIPVYGRLAPVPFWTARRVGLVARREVCRPGGETFAPIEPFPVGPALASSWEEQPDELDGLT